MCGIVSAIYSGEPRPQFEEVRSFTSGERRRRSTAQKGGLPSDALEHPEVIVYIAMLNSNRGYVRRYGRSLN